MSTPTSVLITNAEAQEIVAKLGSDSEIAKRLQRCMDEGNTDRANALRGMARELYHRGGEIEIDDGAVVSEGGDPGAYVMAWVWVGDEDFEG